MDYPVTDDEDLIVMGETTEELRRHVQPLISGKFLRQMIGWTSEEPETIRRRTWGDIA